MDIEKFKIMMNEQKPTFLEAAQPVGGKQTFVCPVCGKGSGIRSGKAGDGIQFDPKTGKWKCFSAECSGRPEEDTLGLWAIHKRIIAPGEPLTGSKFIEAVQTAADGFLYLPVDGISTQPRKGSQAQSVSISTPAPLPIQSASQAPEQKINYFEYIEQCAGRINEEEAIDYLNKRGLSLALAEKYHLGYDPKFYLGEALIIPTDLNWQAGNCFAYAVRIMNPNGDKRYIKHGPQPLFNEAALYEQYPIVVITEGEIDALSVMEAGIQAVALGTAAKANTFIEKLDPDKGFKSDFVILTDMDEAGDTAAEKLEAAIREKGFFAARAVLPNGWKDPNEVLTNEGPDVLHQAIKNAVFSKLDIMDTAGSTQDIDDFIDTLGNDYKIYKTGFKSLDGDGEKEPGIFRGGLRPGLYVLGAEPSCGKTTLALQIAENIVRAGNYVLFFSLEMTREELRDRSLSRITLENFNTMRWKHNISEEEYKRHLMQVYTVEQLGSLTQDAIWRKDRCLTALEIREPKGGRHTGYKREILKDAVKKYNQDHEHGRLYVLEEAWNEQFKGGLTVMDISDEIQRYSRMINATNTTGEEIRPVVVIDYLQLITGDKSDKGEVENVGDTVSRLKRVSRHFKLPILCISSFNRASYNNPTDMRAFRSSGFIEYSADALLGLELAGLRECVYREENKTGYGKQISLWQTRDKIEKGAQEKADNGEDYPVLLSIMKNRQGSKNNAAVLDYNPAYNFFKDSGKTGKEIAKQNGMDEEIVILKNRTEERKKRKDNQEYIEVEEEGLYMEPGVIDGNNIPF